MYNRSKSLRSLKKNYGSKYFSHHLTKNKCHQTEYIKFYLNIKINKMTVTHILSTIRDSTRSKYFVEIIYIVQIWIIKSY